MRTSIVGVVVVVALSLATPVDATLIRAYPMRALSTSSHDIIRGHVLQSEAVYDPVFRRVYTHTVIEVVERLAGTTPAGQLIEVRQIGGVLDGIESRVVGTAPLVLGSEVVVFARTDGAYHYLVGMSQGAYTVDRRSSGEATVHRGGGGLRIAPSYGPAATTAPDRLTLMQLRDEVRDLRGQEAAP